MRLCPSRKGLTCKFGSIDWHFTSGRGDLPVGKNRPLDEDEMAFMDSLADKELSRLKDLHQAEKEELSAFQEVTFACCWAALRLSLSWQPV